MLGTFECRYGDDSVDLIICQIRRDGTDFDIVWQRLGHTLLPLNNPLFKGRSQKLIYNDVIAQNNYMSSCSSYKQQSLITKVKQVFSFML